MIRILLGLLALGFLVACEEYAPPQANCFSFVSHGAEPYDCAFESLNVPALTAAVNE